MKVSTAHLQLPVGRVQFGGDGHDGLRKVDSKRSSSVNACPSESRRTFRLPLALLGAQFRSTNTVVVSSTSPGPRCEPGSSHDATKEQRARGHAAVDQMPALYATKVTVTELSVLFEPMVRAALRDNRLRQGPG